MSPEKPRARVSQGFETQNSVSLVLKGLRFAAAQLEGQMWHVAFRFPRERGQPCYLHKAGGPGSSRCWSDRSPWQSWGHTVGLFWGCGFRELVFPRSMVVSQRDSLQALCLWFTETPFFVWEVFLFWQTEKKKMPAKVCFLGKFFYQLWGAAQTIVKFGLF